MEMGMGMEIKEDLAIRTTDLSLRNVQTDHNLLPVPDMDNFHNSRENRKDPAMETDMEAVNEQKYKTMISDREIRNNRMVFRKQ